MPSLLGHDRMNLKSGGLLLSLRDWGLGIGEFSDYLQAVGFLFGGFAKIEHPASNFCFLDFRPWRGEQSWVKLIAWLAVLEDNDGVQNEVGEDMLVGGVENFGENGARVLLSSQAQEFRSTGSDK